MDQAGMKKQLSDLYKLLKFVDPDLCNHLGILTPHESHTRLLDIQSLPDSIVIGHDCMFALCYRESRVEQHVLLLSMAAHHVQTRVYLQRHNANLGGKLTEFLIGYAGNCLFHVMLIPDGR